MTAVLVTRPAGTEDPLVSALTERGYRVHAVATVVTEAIPIEEASLAGFDWIIVTSAAGVTALPFLPRSARWAAVGTATAAALEAHGITAELVAPAPAQGALAAQARRGDAALLEILGRLDDPAVRAAVETERLVLEATGGTCRAPVGALATVTGERISLLVAGVNSDGSDRRVETVAGSLEEAV